MSLLVNVNEIGVITFNDELGVISVNPPNSVGYRILHDIEIQWKIDNQDYRKTNITDVILNGETLTPDNADEKLKEALFI